MIIMISMASCFTILLFVVLYNELIMLTLLIELAGVFHIVKGFFGNVGMSLKAEVLRLRCFRFSASVS